MLKYSQRLADAVKKARSELGLTQEEVADKCDTDVRTIINMEMGRGNPKLKTLFRVVRALKIDARENSLTIARRATALPFAVYACLSMSVVRMKQPPCFP